LNIPASRDPSASIPQAARERPARRSDARAKNRINRDAITTGSEAKCRYDQDIKRHCTGVSLVQDGGRSPGD
jgi:hypothetical protein